MTDLTDAAHSVSADETVFHQGVAFLHPEIGVKMLDTTATERSEEGVPR